MTTTVPPAKPTAPGFGPHGVVREYAALDPTPGAKPLRYLVHTLLSDASMTVGPDNAFYLTGTTPVPRGETRNLRVSIWRSPDLKQWDRVRLMEFNAGVRSPEIHFLQGRFWMTVGLEGGGTDLLRFDSHDLFLCSLKRAHITKHGEDPSLFLDDDGTFYWVMGAGEIARMKPDPMEGLAGELRKIAVRVAAPDKQAEEQTCEAVRGAFLAKIQGKYHLFVTGRIKSRGFGRTGLPQGVDDVLVAASDSPDSGYSGFYVAFPNAGQTTLFRHPDGALWATYSGGGDRAVFEGFPGAFPVETAPATEPRWPIGFAGLEAPGRFPFGLMLRPDRSFIHENGTGLARPIPMDKVPGQRADAEWIRDTCIILGHDGVYYMTGTSGDMQGVYLWRSPDLSRFEFVNTVWTPDKDPSRWYNANPKRLLWAPEIHYINGTYWIPWCMSGLGNSLLKSVSGRAEGPYEPAFKDNAPVDRRIDASMFQDDDGTVYYVWQDGLIRRLNEMMGGFDGEAGKLLTETGEHVGYEGVFLRKIGSWYALTAAEWCGGGNRADGTYDMMYAVSRQLMGPYSRRRVAVPHAGHGMLFQDKSRRWHAAMFGNDRTAPFRAMPGAVPLDITDTGSDLLIQPTDLR